MNRVENIVAKGEIYLYEKFLLLSQCYHKLSEVMLQNVSASHKGIMQERENHITSILIWQLPHPQQAQIFTFEIVCFCVFVLKQLLIVH